MEKITKESLFDLKSIAQPVQYEEEIFYIQNSINKEENRYESYIYSYHLKTGEKKIWGNDSHSVSGLSLSPNKKYLSFLAPDSKKKQQIMLMPIQGGRAFNLTDEKEGVTSFIWNETGASVYYQTSQLPEEEEKSDFPQSKSWSKLSYKLDGAGLLPENKRYQLKKMDVAFETNSHTILEKDYSFSLKHVAKDESFMLIEEDLDSEDEWKYGSTVYYYNLKDNHSYSLTKEIAEGSFSFGAIKNDNLCLLVGNDFTHGFVTQDKIYLYDIEKATLTCLTENEDLQVGDALISDFQQKNKGVSIEWINDESFIFPVTEHGKIILYQGTIQGKVKEIFNERLHLTDGSLINNESMIITYSTLTNPSSLGLLDLTTKKIDELYNPNEKVLSEVKVSTPEMFWYKGARDWKIQGWYMPPVEQTNNHKAILYIHGGPQVAYGESFFHEMQVHTANGYGVILLNPRGGQGYGQEFVKSILGDYGNEDYEDLMLGLDYCLTEYPEIDKNQVYVAGGSYGGFMTNWIVGHTNRFKAAVTQRSISNWLSFYGTSDIGPFFVKYQLESDLSDVEKLWKMSPLSHVHKAKTPLLVLHGEEDLRCPQEQGEQIYTAMKKNEIPTKMVVYPESSHGLSRQGLPNLRMDRIQQIINWFEEY